MMKYHLNGLISVSSWLA